METPIPPKKEKRQKNVLILPMRNGNCFSTFKIHGHSLRSYPTYEEWKPSKFVISSKLSLSFLSYLWGMETLPAHYTCYQSALLPFLSYLWGMETIYIIYSFILFISSYPTYEEWKLSYIRFIRSTINFLFLSYLWGMETFLSFSVIVTSFSSYPTYEEWKLLFSPLLLFLLFLRSYPTYEEWKPYTWEAF